MTEYKTLSAFEQVELQKKVEELQARIAMQDEALKDLYAQITTFAVNFGEADFYTGDALKAILLAKTAGKRVWSLFATCKSYTKEWATEEGKQKKITFHPSTEMMAVIAAELRGETK